MGRPQRAAVDYRATDLANVEVVRAGFLCYEHVREPVDFVYSRNALHHLPDFWESVALWRIRRALKPGGLFGLRDIVYSFDLNSVDTQVEQWLTLAADHPSQGWTRGEWDRHLRAEYSTWVWLMEPMLQVAGFEIVAREVNDAGPYAAWVLLAGADT